HLAERIADEERVDDDERIEDSSHSASACGHASTRPSEAASKRLRQFAPGVGPRRQWKKVGKAIRQRATGKGRLSAVLCPYAKIYRPAATVSSASRRRSATVLIGVTLITHRSAASSVRQASPSTMAPSAWRAVASTRMAA